MAHVNTESIRIPPDSTGKRLSTTKRTVVFFDGLRAGKQFFVGDTVTATGGVSATITGVNVAGFTAGSGQLYLTEVVGTFVDNAVLQVNAEDVADVNTQAPHGETPFEIYYQDNILVDPQNPELRASFTDQNFLRVSLPAASADTNSYNVTQNNVPAFTFNFDYVQNAVDSEFVTSQADIIYDSGITASGMPFTTGDVVQNATTSAFGRVNAINTGLNLLHIVDVVNPLNVSTPFDTGQTIKARDNDTQSCVISTAGFVNSNQDAKALIVRTGGTEAGAGASLTSQFYVPLSRGHDTEVHFSVVNSSDTPGVTRRFGLFTEENGFYWEILESDGSGTTYDSSGGENTAGETVLCVVHRSKSSGSVVSTLVAQSAFNRNQLDGSDGQGFAIDKEKPNVYWLSIPNNGVGRAKFGVFNEAGEKITAHEFVFYNNDVNSGGALTVLPVSALPFRAEVINNGSGTPSQETTLTINKISVFRQSFDKAMSSFQHANSQRTLRHFDSTAGEIPILGVRARQTRGPASDVNRQFASVDALEVSLLDSRIDRVVNTGNVLTGTDQITLTNHTVVDGTPVYYRANGGAEIGGLTDYGIYYAITSGDNTLQLSESYLGAVTGSPITLTSEGNSNQSIVGLTDGPAILRLRKNSQVADAVWIPHNANLSGTEWGEKGTGFRLNDFIVVATGGSGYAAGDLLELDAGIAHYREAVLKVIEVDGSGAIVRVAIAPATDGHLTETDGTTSANYGSYNGKISAPAVSHKAHGVGQSNTSGDDNATFAVSVAWGHGWWWKTIYGPWADWNLNFEDDDLDAVFVLTHYKYDTQNLVLTAEAQTPKKDVSIVSNINFKEII